MTFGDRLKTILNDLHMTQSELAKRVGCDAATISKLKNGQKKPSYPIIDRIAKALDMAPLRLLDGTKLAGAYAAARANPQELETHFQDEQRKKLEPLLAIDQVYQRILQLHDEHGDYGVTAEVFVFARYELLRDMLAAACERAKSELGVDLHAALVVPKLPDLAWEISNPFADYDRGIMRSKALILKELLKFPGGDNPTTRSQISDRLALSRINRELSEHEREKAEEQRRSELETRRWIENRIP